MLAKNLRFHGHGSLKYLYKNAGTYRSRYYSVRAIENRHRTDPRFAIVISKKVHKSAVGRNRIRRRLYEIIRLELPAMTHTLDVAVIVTSGEALAAPYEDLRQSLIQLLTQAGAYKQ